MKALTTLLLALMTFISANAAKFNYSFNNTPISAALVKICKEHPDVNISFIYKELDSYRTSAKIHTDDPLDAMHRLVGLNPISVIKSGEHIYVEALQHGKYIYTGRAIGSDREPVVAATVMLLSPNDSSVITYGITDHAGRFSIPCDKEKVIGKISCLGYKTVIKPFNQFAAGTIVLPENSIALSEVKVEADNARLYSDKSVYIPTSKQKRASQTAQQLINHMAIPQLRMGEELVTVTGQPVEIYIDYVPATDNDLSGIEINDVKRVEYYDFPADPRFQGNAHVLNLIMQKYEYGGYVKGIYYDNFVTSRQLNTYAKIQYKKMTFDWAGGPFFFDNNKSYEDTDETFRLLQPDGSIKEIGRKTEVDKSRDKYNTYWGSLKALYKTDKVSMSNMISMQFYNNPKLYNSGTVTYTPAEYEQTNYYSDVKKKNNSVSYYGYWFFMLPHNSSITFNPNYAYSHTDQNSIYSESGLNAIINGAVDDSHQFSGDLTLTHSFGKAGTIKGMVKGRFLQNRTTYSGTSNISDKARTYRVGPGVTYSYSSDKLSGSLGIGLNWDKSEYGTISDNTTAPWTTIALQYAFNKKNSLSFELEYDKSIPSSSYRSAAVVQANPLMSYTGNPELYPMNSLQFQGVYTLIPNNRSSISAFAYSWIVGNRYVYDYESTPDGILRTIKQPMGSYAQWTYGFQGYVRFFNNNLQIGAALYMDQAHNGTPYNWTKSNPTGSLSAFYYLKNVTFGATYATPQGYPDGCMVGTWMKPRQSYTFQINYNIKNWKFRFYTRNFLVYNKYATKGVMNSKYYDSTRYIYSSSYAGFFQIMATYSFSFGKKVKAENEAYQAGGAASGILK